MSNDSDNNFLQLDTLPGHRCRNALVILRQLREDLRNGIEASLVHVDDAAGLAAVDLCHAGLVSLHETDIDGDPAFEVTLLRRAER